MKRLHFILFWTTVRAYTFRLTMKISTPTVEDRAASLEHSVERPVEHPAEPGAVPDSAANDADLSDCPDPEQPCWGKSPARPRAADKEARLQNLLDTAAQLFLEKGYGKVSL